MTILIASIDLTDLRHRLTADGYSRHTIRAYASTVLQFLRDLDKRGIALDTVDLSHVSAYLQRRFVQYQSLHHRAPPSVNRWRSQNHGGIPYFLRTALGSWPRPPAPQSPREALDRLALKDYRERLVSTTDFAEGTVEGLLYEANRFLIWSRTNDSATEELKLPEVDAYVKFRARSIRRTTCKTVIKRVARFLHFPHQTGRLRDDLGSRLISPTVYQYESIPSILEPEQIAAVLRQTRRDRSTKGRRDYAVLTLLATYGMRAGEITRLKLQDVQLARRDAFSHAYQDTQSDDPSIDAPGGHGPVRLPAPRSAAGTEPHSIPAGERPVSRYERAARHPNARGSAPCCGRNTPARKAWPARLPSCSGC